MAEREAGFYWVKTMFIDEWEIAEWTGDHWYMTGVGDDFTDSEMAVIGDRVQKPQDNPPPSSPAGCLCVWVVCYKSTSMTDILQAVLDNDLPVFYSEYNAETYCKGRSPTGNLEVRKITLTGEKV